MKNQHGTPKKGFERWFSCFNIQFLHHILGFRAALWTLILNPPGWLPGIGKHNAAGDRKTQCLALRLNQGLWQRRRLLSVPRPHIGYSSIAKRPIWLGKLWSTINHRILGYPVFRRVDFTEYSDVFRFQGDFVGNWSSMVLLVSLSHLSELVIFQQSYWSTPQNRKVGSGNYRRNIIYNIL